MRRSQLVVGYGARAINVACVACTMHAQVVGQLREEIQFTLVIAISQLLLPLGDIPSHSIIYNVLVNQFFNTTIFIKSKSTNVCLI